MHGSDEERLVREPSWVDSKAETKVEIRTKKEESGIPLIEDQELPGYKIIEVDSQGKETLRKGSFTHGKGRRRATSDVPENDYKYGFYCNTGIRLLQIGIAALMFYLSLDYLFLNFSASDVRDVFVAAYVMLSAILLFLYETSRIVPTCCLDRFLYHNFGFLFGTFGKACFLLVTALLVYSLRAEAFSFLLGTTIIVDVALLLIAHFGHYLYPLCKSKRATKNMNKSVGNRGDGVNSIDDENIELGQRGNK